MGAADRLRRLKELRDALDGSGATAPGQPETNPAPDEGTPPDVPQIGARPSGASGAGAGPDPAGPATLAATPTPEAPAAGAPSAPAPQPSLSGLPEGLVPGTMAEFPAGTRGPQALILLESMLSPLAGLDTWQVGVGALLLFVFGGMLAGTQQDPSSQATLGLGPPLLLILGRFASSALFRMVVVPGIRIRVTDLQWSPRQRRAQVDVALSGDVPFVGNWRRAVQVALGAGGPIKPLSVRSESFDGGCKLDLGVLVEASVEPASALTTFVHCPDGRTIGLYARVERWREAKCGRCLSENPACPLCAGDRVQEAMF